MDKMQIIKALLCESDAPSEEKSSGITDNGMIGKYVIVRCKDAGVHAGVLESHVGREAVLNESRRLWYWKSRKGSFLSGVARDGLDSESKVGGPIRVHLTETCEIIECSPESEKTIREAPTHERN